MQKLLLVLVAVSVALAGCTGAVNDPKTTPSHTTTHEEPTDPQDGEGMPAPLECDPTPPTEGSLGVTFGYPEAVFTPVEPSDDDPCYGLAGPASVPAGWTAIALDNTGGEPHFLAIFRLTEDKTHADIREASAMETEPEWLQMVGSVSVVTAGQKGVSLLQLEEGKYAIICFFAGHHMQGMFRILEVTASEGDALPEPTPTLTVELSDFAFGVPTLAVGQHLVALTNVGEANHEAIFARLHEGATMEGLVAAFMGEGDGGPPPGDVLGGANHIAPGATAYIVLDLTPGRYGAVCFVDDEATHKSHMELGMITEFDVAGGASDLPS